MKEQSHLVLFLNTYFSICLSGMSLAEIRTQASKLFRSRFMQMKIIANISFLFCFPVELLIIIYKQNFVHL